VFKSLSNGAFWGLWSVLAAVSTGALLYFSWSGVSAVVAQQPVFGVDEPPHRVDLQPGEYSLYFQYDGPPPGTYRHVIYPQLACTVTALRAGVGVPVVPSPTRDSYRLGSTVGVRLWDFVIRSEGAHAVACKLVEPFEDGRPIRLAVGQGVVWDVFMAMVPPLLGFLVAGGLLAAAIWMRLRAGG
jgi:hypothetical protein